MKLAIFSVSVAAAVLLGGAAQACPDWTLTAAAQYSGSGDFFYQPRAYDVVAGGEFPLAKCSGISPTPVVGPGFFTDRPDFRFEISAMSQQELHIRVNSECDAVLLVNTASATWHYDDDSNGNLDPRIVLPNPADGALDIWVGTVDGKYCNAVLELETF
jgi:hypothetical protein